MSYRKPFWRRPNVVGALLMIILPFPIIVVLGISFPEALKLIEPFITIPLPGNQKITIVGISFISGLITLLGPKFMELGIFQLIFNRNRNAPTKGKGP